jgi:Uma2 family endonuclease
MNQAIKDHLMTTTIADTALPLHLFTVEEYHRMAEAGLFEGQRVELIYGKIVDMSPSKSDARRHDREKNDIISFAKLLDK